MVYGDVDNGCSEHERKMKNTMANKGRRTNWMEYGALRINKNKYQLIPEAFAADLTFLHQHFCSLFLYEPFNHDII